ncbi:MAG: phytanoyl-CoA dioxygenase family protein, partial [Bacteroidota bacterium]
PIEISQNIFSIRIHLDDATENNGALKVMPGSHKKRFTDQEIRTITSNALPTSCEVHTGGIHLIKPLILHASSKSKNQKRRRVIHLDFASVDLPGDLEWLEKEEVI